MSRIGAELGELQSLRSTFDRNAQEVSQLSSTISSQVSSTYWEGPAAERFKGAWEGEFKPALAKLQEALREAGQEVQRRHDAIQSAGS